MRKHWARGLVTAAVLVAAGVAVVVSEEQAAAHGSPRTSVSTKLLATVPTSVGRLNDIACVDSSTCVAVGDHPGAGLGPAFIKRTVDGGATWSEVVAPTGSWGLTAIDCSGSKTCVAVGFYGTTLYSADGGNTWQRSVGTLLEGWGHVTCGSVTTCYASGEIEHFTGHWAVIKTTDGGATWGEIYTTFSRSIRELWCGDADHCLFSEFPQFANPGKELIWRTSDGGATWVEAQFPQAGGLWPVGCMGSTCVVDDTGPSQISWWSFDFGATWTSRSTTIGSWPIWCWGSQCVRVSQGSDLAVSDDSVDYSFAPLPGNGVWAFDCPAVGLCFFAGNLFDGTASMIARAEFRPKPVVAVAPARLLETRSGLGLTTTDRLFEGGGVVPAGGLLELQVGGRGGVDSDAQAAVLNFTVSGPAGAGYVTVFPCGTPRPLASSVNFTRGTTVANAVVTKLSPDGKACLFVSASTHVVADINGFVPGSVSSVVGVTPARLLETRSGPGMATADHALQGNGPVPAGGVVELPIGGRGGVATDARLAMLNVTVTEPESAGFVTVYPCDQPRPLASSVNFAPGATVANAVMTKLSTNGGICLFSSASAHLVVDVNGFVLATEESVVGLVPARLLETRFGTGMTTVDHLFEGGGIAPGGRVTELQVGGRGGVAADASSAILNVTVTEPTGSGYVTLFPCGLGPPNASNLNYVSGVTVANTVITKLALNGKVCLYAPSDAHLVVDVTGYFV